MRRVLAFLALCPLIAAGCGGESTRVVVVDEPGAMFDLQVVEADFPRDQRLSKPARLRISVRNRGDETVPNVAVTVHGLMRRDEQPGLADALRPIYVIERQPLNSETAYVETWTGGPLPPGETHEFAWRMVPVAAGRHEIEYTVAAGLHGEAHARTPGGDQPGGTFTVEVEGAPAQATVDPETGEVVRR